ncbi:MAG: GNAT family N-acetyltransferase [Oscillospiraceae bacterium]|nr:GNAT family N-acetyltransferase [Oscillospiraceae bacterium]
MITLGEITEENWLEAVRLQLAEEQLAFVSDPMGILARAYVYRDCRAQVWTIEEDGRVVGLAMVREFEDEPLGYELQQFFVDRREQGRGIGTAALTLVLDRLRQEGRWPTGEVCVKKADGAALRVYEKAGFVDSGYVDPDVPDALNLVCKL